MLPEAQNSPSFGFQMLSCFAVARHVLVELGTPPIGVRFGLRRVLRAAVPEAAVHEDRDLCLGEDDIDRATGHAGHRDVHSVAHSRGVQEPSDRDLRRSVSGALTAHAGGDGGGGRDSSIRHGGIVPALTRGLCGVACYRGMSCSIEAELTQPPDTTTTLSRPVGS